MYIYFLNVYLFLRERESACERERRGGAEGDRASKAGSVLTAESLTSGSNSQTVRS